MAHHASAKKAIRQSAKNAVRNNDRKSRIKTFVKKLEEAITKKDKNLAQSSLHLAQSELAKGAAKGILRSKTVSRKISRLNAKVKALA